MSDIFISYSREDHDRVRLLKEFLEDQGYTVWWDLDIPPAVSFDDYIRERLDHCKCVIVVWSKTSAGSDYVRGEARAARDSSKYIGVIIDAWAEVKDTLPLDFHGIESADLSDWKGGCEQHEIRLVTDAVANLVRRSAKCESGGGAKVSRLETRRWRWIIVMVAVSLAGITLVYFEFIEPHSPCRVTAKIRPLNLVPSGVIIDYVDVIETSGSHRFPTNSQGSSILEIASQSAEWRLAIHWSDGAQSRLGPFTGCARRSASRSPDGRATLELQTD